MRKVFVAVLFILVMGVHCFSKEVPSSIRMGVYDASEYGLLQSAFVSGVGGYLVKRDVRVITRGESYVEMAAKYQYQLKVEFVVRAEESLYEIIVSVAPTQKRYNEKRAREACSRIAEGAYRAFTRELVRGTALRDRTDRKGVR